MTVSIQLDVRPFGPDLREAFFEVHHPDNGEGQCFCVAWWLPTWAGWGERSAEANRAVREDLLAAGHYDGYLAFDGDRPVGWMQAGPRDRLEKLRAQFDLTPDAGAWAVTCMLLVPGYRRQGLAHQFLAVVLADLASRGVRCVEAFPRVGHALEAGEVWNGPEAVFVKAGFTLVQDGAVRRVYRKELA